MKKLSCGLNVLLLGFFFWYFVIHVGIEPYFKRYVLKSEDFMVGIYYQAKVDRYEELNRLLNKEEEYHVFVGDSLIEQFPVEELYGCQKVLNRGIGQDTTMGLENRLERNINNIRIASCFIMIGRNDLKYRDAEETVERVDKLVKAIKARKKYFVSIPVGVKVEYAEGIMRVNNGIRERAKRGGFEYIDVSKEFVNTNGEIERELFYDDVHLTMSGYERISKILREYLLRLN